MHEYKQSRGILEWEILVKIPEYYNGTLITIKDSLPEGLNLKQAPDGSSIVHPLAITIDGMEYPLELNGPAVEGVSVSENGSDLDFNFSKDFFDQHPGLTQATLHITAGLDKEPEWHFVNGQATVSFENKASVLAGPTPVQEVSQCQQLIQDEKYSPLSKKIQEDSQNQTEFTSNIIPYEVIVNPDGDKLCDQSKPLTVTDQAIVSEQNGQAVSLEIVSGSLQMTDLKTGLPLDADDYSYILSSQNEDGKMVYTITFIVPDQTPLKIQYAYQVNGTPGAICSLPNTARLDSAIQGKMDSKVSQNVKLCQSSVSSDEIGLTIFKTDADNSQKTLPGTQFELYKYNPQTGAFDPIVQDGKPEIFTTGNDGTFSLGDAQLDFGYAYELKETAAPDGYTASDKTWKFVLLSSADDKIMAPQGFEKSAEVFYTSGALYIPNQKTIDNKQSIHIRKQWVDPDGNPADPAAEAIAVTLYRTTANSQKKIVRENIILDEADDWNVTIDDLPVYEMQSADGIEKPDPSRKIAYSVEETTQNDAWSPEISEESGTITVTNRLKAWPVQLPETGSGGLLISILGGGGFLAAAGLVSRRPRRSRKEKH